MHWTIMERISTPETKSRNSNSRVLQKEKQLIQ